MAEEDYVTSIHDLGAGRYGLQLEAGALPTAYVGVEGSGYFDRLRMSGGFQITLDVEQARFTPRDPDLPPGVDPGRVIEGETVRKEIEG